MTPGQNPPVVYDNVDVLADVMARELQHGEADNASMYALNVHMTPSAWAEMVERLKRDA